MIGRPSIASLDQLVAELRSTPDTARFDDVLLAMDVQADDIANHVFFEEHSYTRNLIARTDSFELLALCWMPRQCTLIHDHAGSRGWVLGITGRLEEVRYAITPGVGSEFEAEQFASATLDAGEVSYIDDDIGWHMIENVGKDKAISLHLYAPSIDECQFYDETTKHLGTRRMSYHSKNGILVQA